MLLIQCPWCGERAESEFNYGGEAGIVRPVGADNRDKPGWLDDTQWGDYVFMRKNTRGVFREQWVHTHGCRRWFEAERDTVTHQFLGFHKLGEAATRTADSAGTAAQTGDAPPATRSRPDNHQEASVTASTAVSNASSATGSTPTGPEQPPSIPAPASQPASGSSSQGAA